MSNHTPETITIQLTKGYTTIIDEIDGDLAALKWYAATVNKGYPYAVRAEKQVAVRMHRVILSRILDRELLSSELVDHINRDTLDNRRENLRLATVNQNMQNRDASAKNTSGYKGVLSCPDGTFRPIISNDKSKRTFGHRYATPEEAYVIYCQFAREQYGEFAFLPDEDKVAHITPVRLTHPIIMIATARGTTPDELIPRLFNKLGSIKAVSAELGVSQQSIRNWFKRRNIQYASGKLIYLPKG